MTLRIFYFLIALFSISVVFGLFNNSFIIDTATSDIKVADLRAQNAKIYELNASQNYANYSANEVIRYDDHDEIIAFKGSLKDEKMQLLSADFAYVKDKNITLKNNAKYENIDDNLTYNSNELLYAQDFLFTNMPFVLRQNNNVITGNSGKYDIKNKLIKANNVKGEFIK